jgi:hypothetical protein
MDHFNKPCKLGFEGNTSENWRRFKQQLDIAEGGGMLFF